MYEVEALHTISAIYSHEQKSNSKSTTLAHAHADAKEGRRKKKEVVITNEIENL